MHRSPRDLALALFAGIGVAGCGHAAGLTRDLVDEDMRIPGEGVRSAAVSLTSHSDLEMRGGSCSLVRARARYSANRSQTSAALAVDPNGHGDVAIAMTGQRSAAPNTSLDVCLTTEIPLSLTADVSIGDVDADLSGVLVRNFDASTKTGDVDLDLGDARISASGLAVRAITGDVSVDAQRSTWTGENKLRVSTQTGDITVYVPTSVAVRVTANAGVGDVEIRGLTTDEGRYINGHATTGADRLEIELETTTGDITVIARS